MCRVGGGTEIFMADLQKASMTKRISAFLFDFIVFCIIAVGVAALLSLAFGFDTHFDALEDKYSVYEEKYNVDTNISSDDYSKLSEEELERYEAAAEAFAKDPEIVRLYSMLLSIAMTITSIALLAACVIMEIVFPLIFKNGQTLGKKIFGVALMRVDGVRLTTFQLFVRAVLGKYTIETMIPVFLLLLVFFGVIGTVGLLIAALILVLQIILVIATHNNSCIHDLLSMTVAVDMASQMIFDSPEELMEYKKRIHAEDVKNSEYK